MSTPAVSIEVSNSNAYLFANASNQDVVMYPTSESMRINIGTKSNVNSALMIGSSNLTFTVQPSNNTGSFTFVGGNSNVIMNLLANGNLGIGTANPAYRLDVGGDINFTGTFRQNGAPYIGSQWSNNPGNVFITASNVGIGTNNPQYRLDVGGDINFTGTFRQNGTPYVGSQWSNNSSNVFINGSNIGIGTSTPARLLHVAGDVRFDSNIFVNNTSLSFPGLMVTRRQSGGNANINTVVTQIPGYSWDSNITLTAAPNSNINLLSQARASSNLLVDSSKIIFPSTSTTFLATPTNGANGGNGDRIIFLQGDGTNPPYSFGMSNSTLWYSVPTGANHRWFVNSTAIMSLTSTMLTCTQDIAAFGSISDIKFKQDIESFVSSTSLERVMQLNPVSFKWKTNLFNDTYAGKDDVGFIAQEVESVIPLAVKNTKHGDMEEFKTIKYERLLPYLVGAIHELKKRVEELENERK